MKSCVIIPTVRNFVIVRNYVENCIENGFDSNRLFFLLVTEDFCDVHGMKALLKDLGVEGEVFSETKRNDWMGSMGIGNHLSLIPRKSHAETSFGLLYMWTNGFDTGYLIDDDTLPTGRDFFGVHKSNLDFSGNMTSISSSTRWVNVLYQNFRRHRLYPRGYPYSCMKEKLLIGKSHIKDVAVSQGLWVNVPDLDSLRILMQGDLNGISAVETEEADFAENFVAAHGNYLTVCSMNLAFRREIIPAFYQLPMDDNAWKIGRFDDIWSGIFIKRICDELGKHILNGRPLCRHDKAPRSTFKDLFSEMPALDINENLWKILDSVKFSDKSYSGMYLDIADVLEKEKFAFINADFLKFMSGKMKMWVDAVNKLG